MKRIILIDDKDDFRERLSTDLIKEAGDSGDYLIEAWTEKLISEKISAVQNADNDESNAEEDIYFRLFKNESNVSLVISDRDLSSFSSLKISESSIADACKRLNVPLATYHRRPNASSNLRNFEQVSQVRSYSIAVDNIGQTNSAAGQIIDIARGFDSLFSEIKNISTTTTELESNGPAAILSKILKHPNLEYHFAMYAEGPSVGLDVVSTFSSTDFTNDDAKVFIAQKTAFVLGCWLYNYILSFPGLLLNRVATASFLNLSLDSFDVNIEHFQDSKYSGPFGGHQSFWWKPLLEQQIYSQECDDGLEYLKTLQIDAAPSVCYATESSPAGYYCLIKKQPISFGASRGQLSWIPKGANLCRVENEAYEALASMMSF